MYYILITTLVTRGGDTITTSKQLKKENIQSVKDFFLQNKQATRSMISTHTNLSLSTITTILQELIEDNFIIRGEDVGSNGGRNCKCYLLNKEYVLFSKVSLKVVNNRVFVSITVTNLIDEIVYGEQKSYSDFMYQDLYKQLRAIKDNYNYQVLAVSVPGIVHNQKITKSDIEGLENVDLVTILEMPLDCIVTLENDVNCGMLGYVEVNQVKHESFALLYQADNNQSGCSMYVNENILYGFSNFAGEVGYLPLIQEKADKKEIDELTLLAYQVASIISIINPSNVVLLSKYLHIVDFEEKINAIIPSEHIPKLHYIKGMEEYVLAGLQSLCIKKLKDRK